MLDNILKSELLIADCDQKTKPKRPKCNLSRLNNNINDDISNNNKELNTHNSDDITNSNVHIDCVQNSDLLRTEILENDSIHHIDTNSLQKKRKRNYPKKIKINTKESEHSNPDTAEPKKKCNLNSKLEQRKLKKLAQDIQPVFFKFVCDYCKKYFKKKSELIKHIHSHLKLRAYKCKFCDRCFQIPVSVKNHMKKVHDYEEIIHYTCNLCDELFLSKNNLTEHKLTHKEFSKCVYCNEKFKKHSHLLNHEKIHLIGGRYPCSICKISYDNRFTLTLHVKSHLNIKEHICHFCGKEFLRKNSLRRHLATNHNGQTIQCPVCKKKLKGHLTEHLRVHDKKRPHVCPDCGQRFTQSTQLTVHRRSHSGAKPYNCQICKRPFSHSSALLQHKRTHTGEKPFTCVMCPLSFSQLPHMKTHMQKIHNQTASYRCKKCLQFFKFKTQLETHVKSCNKGDKVLSFEEKVEASVHTGDDLDEGVMPLSHMRFLLAVLLTTIASKRRLQYLGFNKRLIDDILIESLEGMDQTPCKDMSVTPLVRLKTNIQLLLNNTVPEEKMQKFQQDKKTTEELLVLLTNEKT